MAHLRTQNFDACTVVSPWHGTPPEQILALLAEPNRATAALWLCAPAAGAKRLYRQSTVRIVGADVTNAPSSSDPAQLVAWATSVWAVHPGHRRMLSLDPSTWVDVEQSGTRWLARGATWVFGVELVADAAIGHEGVCSALRALVAEPLSSGVFDAGSSRALVDVSADRIWLRAV